MEPRFVYSGTVSDGAGATVDPVPELGVALASRTAAANPMMWVSVITCLLLNAEWKWLD